MGGTGSKSNTDLNSKIMVELMNKVANNFNSEINNYINNNASLSVDVNNTQEVTISGSTVKDSVIK